MFNHYFAYGSNMNPARVSDRGLSIQKATGARLEGYQLVFDKHSKHHQGSGHANIRWSPGHVVEGVIYTLASVSEIEKMDRFEAAPINYSRDMVRVDIGGCPVWTWTYFANPAVLKPGLLPTQAYLDHLLAGKPYLSDAYWKT